MDGWIMMMMLYYIYETMKDGKGDTSWYNTCSRIDVFGGDEEGKALLGDILRMKDDVSYE
jgi:hypothetical protein